MTIRSDITINWEVSPRIIQVDAPSIEISVQDLIDTCMYRSALPANMDDAILLESSGKEYLTPDGSVKVGLTVTLNDAKIAFEARSGPAWVLCDINGGNVVAVEDIYSEPRVYFDVRQPTAYISADKTASSSATLLEGDGTSAEEVANAVWDATLIEHTVSGTFGKAIADIESDTSYILDIKLDTTDLKTDLERALGLMQENQYIDNTSYNGNGSMISGRLRTYTTAGSVGTDNDVLATYTITTVWTGTSMDSYKVVKV